MNKNVIVGGGIALVLALALAFALSGEEASNVDAVVYGEVAVDGSQLPRLEQGSNDPAVGMEAPVLSGSDADGAEITIGGVGEPRIVMFLAHWCAHCQREVPRVTDYLAANDPGVEFVSVATGTDRTGSNFPPSEWLEREGWPVPTIYDDEANTAGTAYGLSAFPFWVVLDSDGIVQSRFTGELDEAQLVSVVEFASGLEG